MLYFVGFDTFFTLLFEWKYNKDNVILVMCYVQTQCHDDGFNSRVRPDGVAVKLNNVE